MITTTSVEDHIDLKRGMKGVYQPGSDKHLRRYLAEFDFGAAIVLGFALTIGIVPRRTIRAMRRRFT